MEAHLTSSWTPPIIKSVYWDGSNLIVKGYVMTLKRVAKITRAITWKTYQIKYH
jgi:hypothetical protein